MTFRSYRELAKLPTFAERYRYLRLASTIGDETFADARWVNQALYHSAEWKRARDIAIIRDNGCDLGMADRNIFDRIYVHHIMPLTLEDFEEASDKLFNPDNLICCSFNTHQAIHYGDESLLLLDPVVRKPNDTIPWR